MTALFDAVFGVFVLAIVAVAALIVRSALGRSRRQRRAQRDRGVDEGGRGSLEAL